MALGLELFVKWEIEFTLRWRKEKKRLTNQKPSNEDPPLIIRMAGY
jgi:hypothetical protein